jgi:hypothetical protein
MIIRIDRASNMTLERPENLPRRSRHFQLTAGRRRMDRPTGPRTTEIFGFVDQHQGPNGRGPAAVIERPA